MYDKRNREALGRVHDQIQRILNTAEKEGDRGLNSSEREKFDELEAEYTKLEARIARNENGFNHNPPITMGLEEMRDVYRASPRQQRERHITAHDAAFDVFIRGGVSALDDDQRSLVLAGADVSAMSRLNFKNVTSTTTGSQGGVLIPTGFSQMLEVAMKWFGGIDGVVGEFRTDTGNPWPWPTLDDTSNQGRILGQNVQVTQTDPVFNSVTFNAYIGSSDLCLIPLALMEDSFFDFGQLLADMLGTRLGRLLNNKCTVGSGVAEPTGIVTDVVASGNVLNLSTGSTSTISYNQLVDLEHSVNPSYRYNDKTRFMFNDTTLKVLKKLVDWPRGFFSAPAFSPAV